MTHHSAIPKHLTKLGVSSKQAERYVKQPRSPWTMVVNTRPRSC